MEQISFEETAKELSNKLELVLGRLSVQAESHLSTYDTEREAQRIAGKLSNMSVFLNLTVYKISKDESTSHYDPEDNLIPSDFMKYAKLCKDCHQQLSVRDVNQESYCELEDGLFVKISDLPDAGELPRFKVKIVGNNIMAVRSDLLAKLPNSVQKLLKGDTNGD